MSDIEGDSDFFYEDSTSEDEIELEPYIREERMKNKNYLEETVAAYSEEVFFEHFRMTRGKWNMISEQFRTSDYYHNHSGKYGNIPAPHQVLIFLWYIGHETVCFTDCADRFDITITSLERIIYRMVMFLSNLSRSTIKWPTQNEKIQIEQHFRENGFPNVIGAVDGCHVKIVKPKNDPESYINRKGYYSVHMQVVCDHKRKITDLFVGYPGSVHDSRVFNNSPLSQSLEQKCGQYFILADSGYPLKPNVLTPYKDRGNLTRRQLNYNIKLAKNRYVIEHCFGILKQKFRELYHIKLRNMQLIVHFIRAACVLHNICLDDNIDFEIVPPQNPFGVNDNEAPVPRDDIEDLDARLIRNNVANSLEM